MSYFRRHASTLALAGAFPVLWLLGASLLFGALRPGYSANHAISELGAQGASLAVAWNVIGFGGTSALYGVFAIAVGYGFGRGWIFWLTAAQAVAIAGGGMFSCDPGCPQTMVTPVGWGHTFFGLAYFALSVILPGVAAREFRRRAEWRQLAAISIGACAVLVVLFVAGPSLFGAAHIGLWQRSFLPISGAWLILVALRLRRSLRQVERGAAGSGAVADSTMPEWAMR